MPETHKIRIAVLMLPSGEWDSRGWGYAGGNVSDTALRRELLEGALGGEPGAKFMIFETEVEPPEPPTETVICGKLVEEVDHG